MKNNMTIPDRFIRLIIAAVITGLYFLDLIPGIWGNLLMLLSFVFVITSFFNYCPVYKVLGIKRWEKKSAETEFNK
jgi:hypothetical protein